MNSFCHGSCSVTDSESHAVNPFARVSLLAVSFHCKESGLVRGLWFLTIDTGPSLGLLLDSQLMPCVVETLQLRVCRTGPPHMFLYSP